MSGGGGNASGRDPLQVSALYASSLNAEITALVLLSGVLVGLALVVVVLCVCKCCLRPSKTLKRQQVVFTKYSSERVEGGRYQAFERRVIDVERGATKRTEEEEGGPPTEEVASPTDDNRVFPQCSRESSQPKSTQLGHASLSRTAEALLYEKERRRFPRSPPIQRQSSICLQTSDEQLDRCVEAAALASPEGSSEDGVPDGPATVSAEVHQTPRRLDESPPARCAVSTISLDGQTSERPTPPPPRAASASDLRRATTPPSQLQHAASTEDGALETMMEVRRRENVRLMLVRHKAAAAYDDDEPRSKVRYNDTGSREEVNEDALDVFVLCTPDAPPDTEAMALQSRKLWELRATFEEDEQLSASAAAAPPPPPPPEAKRQSYKKALARRVHKSSEQSADNSFDSVESSSTDASRLEAVTTSMESTTDNTDSTGDGQINRLQQMKHDSGYKSLEANGSKTVRKQIHFAVDDTDDDVAARIVRDGAKTASKKRRDYTRERQLVESSFGSEGSKASVFTRFFRGSRAEEAAPCRSFHRDFSIDEKSDALFHEFSRREPVLDTGSARCRSPRLRHRLSRSAIGSPRSKLSPQDSIEEERRSVDNATTTAPDIPIIKVADEDSQ